VDKTGPALECIFNIHYKKELITMAKSRLNPNKGSRSTLRQLQDKGVLDRQKVGLRHIIKPEGAVQPAGFDVGFPWDQRDLPNFYPGCDRVHVVTEYNGQRAELLATVGRSGYEDHVLDVSAHFPSNQVATDLLTVAYQNRQFGGYRQNDIVYGDAVLTTDNRMHWVFRPYKVPADEVRDFDMLLSTPRTLLDEGNRVWIFFHEEPHQSDIVAFKMRWL
jgi:hypothetical protein